MKMGKKKRIVLNIKAVMTVSFIILVLNCTT